MSFIQRSSRHLGSNSLRSFSAASGQRILLTLAFIACGSTAFSAGLPANAVSWWKAENNANDSVGTRNGTMQNGAGFTAGKVGQAFTFDGVDDHVRIATPFTAFASEITVECWINFLPGGGGMAASQAGENADQIGSNVWLLESVGSGRMTWYVNDSQTWRVNDANYQGSASGTLAINPPPPTPLPADAVSWWRAENNANDSVGTRHGTLQGGATIAAGKVGQAFNFDGVDDYVRVAAPFTGFGNQITVEYWINKNPTSALGVGMSQSSEGADSMDSNVWLMLVGGGNQMDWYVNDNGAWRLASTPAGSLSSSGWHHIAGVADSASTRIYLDGVLVGTGGGIAAVRLNPSAVVHIGKDARNGGGAKLKGQLDEITVYDRALAAAEIQAIFNAGSAGKISNVPPSFVGATTTLSLLPNAAATDITALFHVSDTDSDQTLTWTRISGPSHGTVNITGGTASSGGTDIAPIGSITYTPEAGFVGTDTFTIEASDGTDTDTLAISVTARLCWFDCRVDRERK